MLVRSSVFIDLLPWGLPFKRCLYLWARDGGVCLLSSHTSPLSALLKPCQFSFPSLKAGFIENPLASPGLRMTDGKAKLGSVLVF